MTDASAADNASSGATYPIDEEPTRVGVHLVDQKRSLLHNVDLFTLRYLLVL
jgi:hypothetical protein